MSHRVERNPSTGVVVDLLGPTIEFLVGPDDGDDFCVLRGVVPPGGVVPLHGHPDTEGFVLVDGTLEVLRVTGDDHEWITVRVGDHVHMGGDAPHAWRNTSDRDAVAIVSCTPTLARFLRDVGRPIAEAGRPPTAEYLAGYERTGREYGFWLATPAENARYGIHL